MCQRAVAADDQHTMARRSSVRPHDTLARRHARGRGIGDALTEMTCLSRLAVRTREPKLHERTIQGIKRLCWTVPIYVLVFVLMPTQSLIGSSSGTFAQVISVMSVIFGCAGTIAFFMILVEIVSLTSVMLRYRRAFQQCLAEATASAHDKKC